MDGGGGGGGVGGGRRVFLIEAYTFSNTRSAVREPRPAHMSREQRLVVQCSRTELVCCYL